MKHAPCNFQANRSGRVYGDLLSNGTAVDRVIEELAQLMYDTNNHKTLVLIDEALGCLDDALAAINGAARAEEEGEIY
jgi:hypothetical protein